MDSHDGLHVESSGSITYRRQSQATDDRLIQATNDEATDAKASCAQFGYFYDPFVACFAKKTSVVERKPPEIQRGYYARVKIVEDLTRRFLNIFGQDAQVLNLGSGFDTLYWRLTASESGLKCRKFVEIDFSSITAKKICHIVRSGSNTLKSLISNNDQDLHCPNHRDLHGPLYSLIGADIRDLKEVHQRLLTVPNFSFSSPTLILAECVLIYMTKTESDSLCSFLRQHFAISCFINYELVNVGDKFGEVFKQNMAYRGLQLGGLNVCCSLQSQINRFLDSQWAVAEATMMTDVYDKHIDSTDRKRIEAIEFLDEKELLTQLLQHYCVTIALSQDHQNLRQMLL